MPKIASKTKEIRTPDTYLGDLFASIGLGAIIGFVGVFLVSVLFYKVFGFSLFDAVQVAFGFNDSLVIILLISISILLSVLIAKWFFSSMKEKSRCESCGGPWGYELTENRVLDDGQDADANQQDDYQRVVKTKSNLNSIK
ncbi:hypothetical protein AGMMS49941_10420 [Deferribacterales bacterium]|nr:hypothetical protein AGMMS49941_10420 [Deferribacterales bacterium]